jgi:hypothetical protein
MRQKTALAWEYGQPWLPQLESAFAPGWVAIGCENNVFVVRADLHDACVMRDEFPFNFPAFTKCDAFEIFLGPADEKAYYELHVTPANGVLQIFFEGTGKKKNLEERTVAEPLFTSETTITTDGWSVTERIPLSRLFRDFHPEWLLR